MKSEIQRITIAKLIVNGFVDTDHFATTTYKILYMLIYSYSSFIHKPFAKFQADT